MKLDLSDIPEDGLEVSIEEPPAVLGLDDPTVRLLEPVTVRLRVRIVGRDVLADGELRVKVSVLCCRCAQFFDTSVQDTGFECVRALPEEAVSVDLTSDIRESILLAFPSYPVCRKDCRGLCAQCGIDLNREQCGCGSPDDLRWGALDDWEAKR